MGKLEALEHQIQSLSPEELARFREWFLEYDWSAWDGQIESDAGAAKLDRLAERALQRSGRKNHAALKHRASPDSWACYRRLPQESARSQTELSSFSSRMSGIRHYI
jgi:hypothetical protein